MELDSYIVVYMISGTARNLFLFMVLFNLETEVTECQQDKYGGWRTNGILHFIKNPVWRVLSNMAELWPMG
jgi:hypothetical protein